MHSRLIARPARLAAIAALVLAVAVALTFALMSSGTPAAHAAVKHAAAKHATTNHVARAQADPAGPSDGDTVQSGDQSTPDPTSSETSGESAPESEAGQPGEPANGHQDTGTNAQNDCTGNCVQ
jgi:hypothetical protein